MNKNKLNKIYDILVSQGGVVEDMRDSFVFLHSESKEPCDEWRFSGKLGFGGKYRSKSNTVDCYVEDETAEVAELIKKINEALTKI